MSVERTNLRPVPGSITPEVWRQSCLAAWAHALDLQAEVDRLELRLEIEACNDCAEVLCAVHDMDPR